MIIFQALILHKPVDFEVFKTKNIKNSKWNSVFCIFLREWIHQNEKIKRKLSIKILSSPYRTTEAQTRLSAKKCSRFTHELVSQLILTESLKSVMEQSNNVNK